MEKLSFLKGKDIYDGLFFDDLASLTLIIIKH